MLSTDDVCPVCDQAWVADAARCRCGFARGATDANVAVERLLARRRKNRTMKLRAALLALSPLAAIPILMSAPFGLVWALLLPSGAVMSTLSIRTALRARAEGEQIRDALAAARSIGQLPPAKIVD